MKKMKILSLMFSIIGILGIAGGFIAKKYINDEISNVKDGYAQIIIVGNEQMSRSEFFEYADSQLENVSKLMQISIIVAVVFAVLWIVSSILVKSKSNKTQENSQA